MIRFKLFVIEIRLSQKLRIPYQRRCISTKEEWIFRYNRFELKDPHCEEARLSKNKDELETYFSVRV